MKPRSIIYMIAVLAIVALVYVISRNSGPDPAPVAQQQRVWSVEMLELARISIGLSSPARKESWVKREDKFWYFDTPEGPRVRQERWGGGIPLILSGPTASRIIAKGASREQLQSYGLVNPHMKIGLTTEDGESIDIEVGSTTPTGQNYYVRLADSKDVYAVDYSWHDVLERLVIDPPFPASNE